MSILLWYRYSTPRSCREENEVACTEARPGGVRISWRKSTVDAFITFHSSTGRRFRPLPNLAGKSPKPLALSAPAKAHTGATMIGFQGDTTSVVAAKDLCMAHVAEIVMHFAELGSGGKMHIFVFRLAITSNRPIHACRHETHDRILCAQYELFSLHTRLYLLILEILMLNLTPILD